MKLLYCEHCGDIFNLLGDRVKECHCGRTKGVYINHSEAITNGGGHSLAIGNGSFGKALYQKCIMEGVKTEEYDREKYLNDCRIEYTWCRPNDGEGNPHTFVVDEDHWGWGKNEEDE